MHMLMLCKSHTEVVSLKCGRREYRFKACSAPAIIHGTPPVAPGPTNCKMIPPSAQLEVQPERLRPSTTLGPSINQI
jgi:hypothetical protein